MQDHCLSGAAEGADAAFGAAAGSVGHLVTHFSFENHRRDKGVPAGTIYELSEDYLKLADPYLIAANKWIKRNPCPKSHTVRSLIRRNYYQVREAERVYGVTKIKDGLVDGGTAWAVYMFIDRHEGKACEVYIYDLNTLRWVTWDGEQWVPVTPPRPHGTYAGIGSRDLPMTGRVAIIDLYTSIEDDV